jgi:hypothetical protein
MARAYHSTVFDASADRVWSLVRDFGNYRLWVDGVDESGIEEGRAGDAVGAVRFVRIGETRIRQRLLAHSDLEHCYSYEFAGTPRFPLRGFLATIRVTPVVDAAAASSNGGRCSTAPPRSRGIGRGSSRNPSPDGSTRCGGGWRKARLRSRAARRFRCSHPPGKDRR